ncbi:hypothetical protein [Candidatus Coxiella mudrowiae]|uniref:hypothetical protein n=1 Tax=Candidatus Coxiella mudrowiae TaxID=2054173 RepID=UPI00069EE6A9|nr:hypothetical protein [Candidatus Coxiella mudrowiae]
MLKKSSIPLKEISPQAKLEKATMTIVKSVFLWLGGVALLFVSSELLVDGAVNAAQLFRN